MKWNILLGSLVLSLGLGTQSFGANLLDRMLGANYNGDCDTVTRCETSVADPSCGHEEVADDCCVPPVQTCRKTPLLDMLRGCRRDSCCDPCDEAVCVEDPCLEPTCGVEDPCGDQACGACVKCRKRPLLDMLRSLRQKATCDPCCEPTCGVEDPCLEPTCSYEDPCGDVVCDCCRARKRPGLSLLKRIFGSRKKVVCRDACEPTCGHEPSCGFETAPPSEPTEAKEGDGDEDGDEEGDEEDEVGPAPVVDPTAFLPTKRRFIQTNLVR
ncbi:MAG: hypothetical protein ACODAD_09030 [Planctomycetota bacterium]